MITYELNSSHLSFAHQSWKSHLSPDDLALDATCGNGHDTLFLAQQLPQGTVIGFDIQEEALEQTRRRTQGMSNVTLYHCCHSEIPHLILPQKPRLIVYNLGYLPGGDKTVTTKTETTLHSLKGSLEILAEDGTLSVTCYPGHEEGAREEAAVVEWAQGLNCSVGWYRTLKRREAPSFLWISPIMKKLPQMSSGSLLEIVVG